MRQRVLPLFIAVLCWVSPAQAANYPLQILLPIASGTTVDVGQTAIDSDHRIFWAYGGIEYNIRAAVIGGKFPYTFALSGQPTGMTISSTGVISWTATADGTSAGPITLTVTDAESTQATSSWSITVQNSKFKFLDADAAGGGSGTLASPYNSISVLKDGTVTQDYIIYFRGATANYTMQGATYTAGSSYGQFRRSAFSATSRSIQWLAYPGESPVIDLGGPLDRITDDLIDTSANTFARNQYVIDGGTMDNGDPWVTGDYVEVQTVTDDAAGTATTFPSPLAANTGYYIIRVDANTIKLAASYADALAGTAIDITTQGAANSITVIGMPYIEFTGAPAYFEGFTVQNGPNKFLNHGSDTHYFVVRNNAFSNNYGGGSGQNSGFIMINQGGEADYVVYQDNTFTTFRFGSAIKVYNTNKMLIENNTISDGTNAAGNNETEGLALKATIVQPTVRQNVIHDVPNGALSGNQNGMLGGELSYNLIYNATVEAVILNHDGTDTEATYFHRNTIVGPVYIRMGTGDGPFYLERNVIVNELGASPLPGIDYWNVDTDTSVVTLTEQLVGAAADGIVDSVGKLQGSYRTTYLGTRGYELGSTATSVGVIGGVRFNGVVRIQ